MGDEVFSNIGSINQIWKTLVSSENLSEADKTIAQDILDLMESYKNDRESNLNLAEKEFLFKSNWSKIFAELKTKMNTDVARDIVDLQDSAYETALGSKKAVAKVNTCKSGDASTCKCGDLAWYKRWWNTMKGWFGSKVTNCIKAAVKKTMIDLKAKKAAVLGACSKLPWYKRWFNTIKGWFGSKITNCIKAAVKKSKKITESIALVAGAPPAAPKPAAKKVAVAKPVATKSVAAIPVAAKPVAAKPVAAKPAAK